MWLFLVRAAASAAARAGKAHPADFRGYIIPKGETG
jgi:hypothetical protein